MKLLFSYYFEEKVFMLLTNTLDFQYYLFNNELLSGIMAEASYQVHNRWLPLVCEQANLKSPIFFTKIEKINLFFILKKISIFTVDYVSLNLIYI